MYVLDKDSAFKEETPGQCTEVLSCIVCEDAFDSCGLGSDPKSLWSFPKSLFLYSLVQVNCWLFTLRVLLQNFRY